MLKTILGLFARHMLTAAGGALSIKGLITASEVEPLVGAVFFIAGTAWSAYQKYKTGQLAKPPAPQAPSALAVFAFTALIGAALLAPTPAQATCTLIWFRAPADADRQLTFLPEPSQCVNRHDLAANVAETDTVPTGATRVVLGTNCSELHVAMGASIASITGDLTDGSAADVNPTGYTVTGYTQVTVESPATCRVSLKYYK